MLYFRFRLFNKLYNLIYLKMPQSDTILTFLVWIYKKIATTIGRCHYRYTIWLRCNVNTLKTSFHLLLFDDVPVKNQSWTWIFFLKTKYIVSAHQGLFYEGKCYNFATFQTDTMVMKNAVDETSKEIFKIFNFTF